MSHLQNVAGSRLSRRTLLRGMGAALALPWLEAMTPLARAATSAGQAPNRQRIRKTCRCRSLALKV